MQVQNVNNTHSFGAKIIIGDERVNPYIKSAFISKIREMIDLLDTFNESNSSQIVTVNVKHIKGKDFMAAKNGVTGQFLSVDLGSHAEILTLTNRNSFYDLVKKMLGNNSFWNKLNEGTADMTALESNIEHDVFKLNK